MKTRGKVSHIAFTVYPVKNMARARRFYEKALGLKVTKSFKGKWIEYHLKNGCFAIAEAGSGYKPNAKGGQLAFEVDDVDLVTARLVKRGGKLKMAPGSGSVCRMAEVIDTEGNAICLHKKHPDIG